MISLYFGSVYSVFWFSVFSIAYTRENSSRLIFMFNLLLSGADIGCPPSNSCCVSKGGAFEVQGKSLEFDHVSARFSCFIDLASCLDLEFWYSHR